jgi:Copper transport outer membrane protein, MctB
MFDLRYHVASLAAVFVALIIGILVGVGLSGSGVTNKAELQSARLENHSLQKDLTSAQAKLKQLKQAQDAFQQGYPAMLAGRLTGREVAVLFVGPVDGGISSAVEQTLVDGGAPPVLRERAVDLPINAEALDALLTTRPALAKYVGDDQLTALGRALGQEFVHGGATPLWNVLGRRLVEEKSGPSRPSADGVVVVRTVKPQQGATARFLSGLFEGLASSDVPAVGVEKSGSKVSAVGVYRDRGLSAVDDVDLATGRAALGLLLAGAGAGHYGTADDADAVLPTFPSG